MDRWGWSNRTAYRQSPSPGFGTMERAKERLGSGRLPSDSLMTCDRQLLSDPDVRATSRERRYLVVCCRRIGIRRSSRKAHGDLTSGMAGNTLILVTAGQRDRRGQARRSFQGRDCRLNMGFVGETPQCYRRGAKPATIAARSPFPSSRLDDPFRPNGTVKTDASGCCRISPLELGAKGMAHA